MNTNIMNTQIFHLSFREFEKILPITFIYESILIKIYMNTNIMNTQILKVTKGHFHFCFNLNLSTYGQLFVLVLYKKTGFKTKFKYFICENIIITRFIMKSTIKTDLSSPHTTQMSSLNMYPFSFQNKSDVKTYNYLNFMRLK